VFEAAGALQDSRAALPNFEHHLRCSLDEFVGATKDALDGLQSVFSQDGGLIIEKHLNVGSASITGELMDHFHSNHAASEPGAADRSRFFGNELRKAKSPAAVDEHISQRYYPIQPPHWSRVTY
jgi:hypothetical protein